MSGDAREPVDVPDAPPLAAAIARAGENLYARCTWFVFRGYSVANWVEPRERQLRTWADGLLAGAYVLGFAVNDWKQKVDALGHAIKLASVGIVDESEQG